MSVRTLMTLSLYLQVKARKQKQKCALWSRSKVIFPIRSAPIVGAVGTREFTFNFNVNILWIYSLHCKVLCVVLCARGKDCLPPFLPSSCLSALPSNQLSKSTRSSQKCTGRGKREREREEEFKNDVRKMNIRIAAFEGKGKERDFKLITKSGSGTEVHDESAEEKESLPPLSPPRHSISGGRDA